MENEKITIGKKSLVQLCNGAIIAAQSPDKEDIAIYVPGTEDYVVMKNGRIKLYESNDK